MGSGKTAFAQGFGAGLGVTEPITSPTFTIVREYEGRLALHHIDAYRLEHLQEVAELGVAEMLDEAAVMLVEWGDAIRPALPPEHLEVHLDFGDGDDDRDLGLTASGSRWLARHRALCQRLAPWTVSPANGTSLPAPGHGTGAVGARPAVTGEPHHDGPPTEVDDDPC